MLILFIDLNESFMLQLYTDGSDNIADFKF